jgi:hypothetical protein
MDGDLGSGDGGRRSGRKTRRGGRGYWEGRTSQSIDGRLDMRLCPSRSVPGPAPAWASIYFLICSYHGSSRRRSVFGKECGSAHLRSSHSKSLALGSCTLHTACISIHWYCKGYNKLYFLACVSVSFLTATCIKSKSEHIMECPRSSDMRTCVSCVRE